MADDAHVGFVVAAYSIAALVVSVMIIAIWRDYRRLNKELERLDPPDGAPAP